MTELPAPAARTPSDVRDLADRLYHEAGPLIGCHSPCRELGLIALGAAAAWGIPAALRYDPHYREGRETDQHFWLEFATGERLDRWQGRIRLQPPRRAA